MGRAYLPEPAPPSPNDLLLKELYMNINDKVEVQLTAIGLEIWRESSYNWETPKNGQLQCQLWVLMHVFGPSCFNGGPQCFVRNKVKIV